MLNFNLLPQTVIQGIKFTLCLGLFMSCINLFAQENRAKLVFERETIDLGTISKNSDGSAEFNFTNEGNAPLIIKEVKSTCGCIVYDLPKAPILPGEKSSIKVRYDTKIIGVFRKSIAVFSNAEKQRQILRIKGTVTE